MKFGLYIKKWRINHCLTQEEMAKLCGISRQILNRIENGYTNIGAKTMIKLSKACKRKTSFMYSMLEKTTNGEF